LKREREFPVIDCKSNHMRIITATHTTISFDKTENRHMIEPINHCAYLHLGWIVRWEFSFKNDQVFNVKLFCTHRIKDLIRRNPLSWEI
jgi:hypothetical protein